MKSKRTVGFYLLLFLLALLFYSCRKEQVNPPINPFANTSWLVIQIGVEPVIAEADKKYLFFTSDKLDNYYAFISSRACFNAETSNYKILNNDKMRFTYWDNSSEDINYKINSNGTLEFITDWGLVITFQPTTIKQTTLSRCP